MHRYILYLSLITALITALFFALNRTIMVFDPGYTWWALPLIFFAISLAGHGLMVRSFKGKPDQFMIYFLLATTVKMLLYLGLLLAWFVLSGHQLTMQFAGAFAVLYFSLTILDLFSLLAFKRKNL
jgi:hypothetical protein